MSAVHPAQPQIALTLLVLKRRHQQARALADLYGDEASESAVQEIEVSATETLRLIVAVHGWPGHSLVGEAGANAAWWVAHHAPDHAFQQHALVLLEAAVAAGEATRRQLAFLTDRCRVMAGRPQLYGTQFRYHLADLHPYPVEDPDRLDGRRAEVGLEPFGAFDKLVRVFYPPFTSPSPPDPDAG
ncbi:DUF6624 domain-containing protein [Streptomyces sp. YGL11-2]|uniref:DUF6624 domain-containing protein n=1 Tax=Streptomyces sp. YGL11-2 TaxID=3414028 RepID=UPI003CFA5A64